jgi:Uma2 family endonuclease
MTVAVAQARFTPDDVLRLEEQGLYELVEGKLIEKQTSRLANLTAGRIAAFLNAIAMKTNAFEVLPGQTFQCFPDDPDKLRRPDVAVIVHRPGLVLPDEGHLRVVPDLVIEVISPTDKIYELDEQLEDYRNAGVKVAWVVNPKACTVEVHHLDRDDYTIDVLDEKDTLTGGSIVPDFSVPVRDLPPRPSAAAPA